MHLVPLFASVLHPEKGEGPVILPYCHTVAPEQDNKFLEDGLSSEGETQPFKTDNATTKIEAVKKVCKSQWPKQKLSEIDLL